MIHVGDALTILRTMPDESVHCVVTSPPYWGLRDYGTGTWDGGDPECKHSVGGQVEDTKAPGAITTGQRPGVDASICRKCGARRIDQQLGLERTPEEYIDKMVAVFREVRRVLRSDGTVWVNMGDSYATSMFSHNSLRTVAQPMGDWSKEGQRREKGERSKHGITTDASLKPKDLCGIPWRLALALQADGWYLRADIIWHKPNPMPESVTDRPTKAHEYVFLLSKSARYFYDSEAVKEPGITTRPDLLAFGPRPDVGYTGHMQNRKRKKVPAGWDTVDHGRAGNGRFTDKQRESAAQMPGNSHHVVGFNDRWDATEENGTAPRSRNARSVWTIATQPFPEAHFATFPEALAERCIRAGTSERGCCPECGAPWVRVVEKSYAPTERAPAPNKGRLGAFGERAANMTRDGFVPNREPTRTTLGFRPSCSHDGDPVPCAVLDPFAGAGTTLLVAAKLNRRGVGIELKPEYAAMAERRVNDELPLFAGANA